MISLIVLTLIRALGASAAPDTIDPAMPPSAPVVDGVVSPREYDGDPRVRFRTTAGEVRVWIARQGDFVYIAATVPDSTFYWGDDFVVSLDADGSADATPQPGDRQWYLRRTLESSIVSIATAGRWNAPGHEPSPLGRVRHTDDWDVASSSSPSGWSVELRIRAATFQGSGAALPRLAFRTYNDRPAGWWSWPAPPPRTPAQQVELSPGLWMPVRLAGRDHAR